jgi:hypothetical protein
MRFLFNALLSFLLCDTAYVAVCHTIEKSRFHSKELLFYVMLESAWCATNKRLDILLPEIVHIGQLYAVFSLPNHQLSCLRNALYRLS